MEATANETLIALLVLNVRNMQVPAAHGTCHESCSTCAHRREHFYSHHILCAKPDAKMTGDPHGIKKGWFMYPFMFDPVWKTSPCANHEPSTPKQSSAVSLAAQ
jgi:hypothetical protein